MERAYRRWACGLLAAVLTLLAACAGLVYTVDPCLYYRVPREGRAAFFNERYQAAGMVKNLPADTVLMGTSMAANYRSSRVGEVLGGTGLRITIPDGYLSEFDRVMELLFRSQTPKRVVFLLDANILVRDESGVTGAMPDYLYNTSRLDDGKYLLNKDVLYYSVYTLLERRMGRTQPLEEGFTWGEDIWWNHMTALEEYRRPEPAAEPLAADAYRKAAADNLAVITGWLDAHPGTRFDIVFSPYSILYWDKTLRQGAEEAVFTALGLACETLLSRDNVRLFAPLMDREIVEDLDHYCDYVHHDQAVCGQVLEKIAAGQGQLDAENYAKTLANWREFVVHYDYEKFWDEAFWIRWNETHQTRVQGGAQ